MSRLIRAGLLAICSLGAPWGTQEVWGDFIVYQLPGTRFQIVFEGRTVSQGKAIVYNHPNRRFGELVFTKENVKLYEVEDLRTSLRRQLKEAVNDEDADAAFEVATEALRKAWIDFFKEALEATLKIDEEHPDALAINEVIERTDEPIEEGTEEEELRAYVKYERMEVEQSPHFILLHDIPAETRGSGKRQVQKTPERVTQRLELLEQVYATFILYFTARGHDLEIPRERLKVVLFAEEKDYLNFAGAIDPSLLGTNGFFDPIVNISFFYDRGSEGIHRKLREFADNMETQADSMIRQRVPGRMEFVRFAKTMGLLVDVARENDDLTVVSHEATHQLAANTGLFPRHVRVPSWVHEGLATYFENPRDATWSGVGAVNEERLAWYKGLEPDREHSNIEFIAGDQIFKYAGSHGSLLHGYGQAWALTHFLMDEHFEDFMKYYKQLGDLPPDTILAPELLNRLFDRVFDPSKRSDLDRNWRDYMGRLKTDFEIAVAEAEKKEDRTKKQRRKR